MKIKFTSKPAEVFLLFVFTIFFTLNLYQSINEIRIIKILMMGIHFVLIYLYAIKSPKLEMGLKVWASVLMLAGIVIIITTILIDPNLSSLTSSKSINGIASLLIGVVIYLIAADYIEPDIPPIESHIDHLIED